MPEVANLTSMPPSPVGTRQWALRISNVIPENDDACSNAINIYIRMHHATFDCSEKHATFHCA